MAIKSLQEIPFFKENDITLNFYLHVVDDAKFIVQLIWESAKFFTTITSALITSNIALFSLYKDHYILNGLPPSTKCLLSVIPVMVITVSIVGIENLKREYNRFLDFMIVIDKIQTSLGLYEQFESTKYKEDKYIFFSRVTTTEYKNSEDFKKKNFNRKNTLYFYFKLLHIVYIALSILMIVVIVLL